MKARVIVSPNDIKREARRQLLEAKELFVSELEILFLYTLHTQLGFGKKRLKRMYHAFSDEFYEMCQRYEMDDCFPMKNKLERIGVNIDEWHKEYTKGIK